MQNSEKLIFSKGTTSKGCLQSVRVEPIAKEIIDRLAAETGLTAGYITTAIITWAEDKIEIR